MNGRNPESPPVASKELLFRMQTVAALVKNDEIKAALSDGIAEIARLTKECAELKSDAAYFRENRDLVGAEVERLRAALLQHDGWLANTGHFADHPWRLHIARTLEGSAGETTVLQPGEDIAEALERRGDALSVRAARHIRIKWNTEDGLRKQLHRTVNQLNESPEKANVCTGCNSTPCICSELNGDGDARG